MAGQVFIGGICIYPDAIIKFIQSAHVHFKAVISRLRDTRFIIACQLPVSDRDDDGYDANGELMSFVAAQCDGLIQADGEGFYDGDEMLLALD